MPRELSELTLIVHRMNRAGSFVYQRLDNYQKIEPENIEFLKEYPNPFLVSRGIDSVELIKINSELIPQRANAFVIGENKFENEQKVIYPAVYCHVAGLSENQ